MKPFIKNHTPCLSIPAVPVIGPALRIILHPVKIILKSRRFFFPPQRKFYYPGEEAAFRHAAEIKKNAFPGQGPPR